MTVDYEDRLPRESLKISDFVISLSSTLDLADVRVLAHSQRVAYIVLELARDIDGNLRDFNQTVLAALLHDIGIESTEIQVEVTKHPAPPRSMIEPHCRRGAELLRDIGPFTGVDALVLSHHDAWNRENSTGLFRGAIPLESRLIHLADRIEAQIDRSKYILHQRRNIIEEIQKFSGDLFDPHLVEVLEKIGEREDFWLNLETGRFRDVLREWGEETSRKVSLSEIEEIAGLFATIIDQKSPFTTRHSAGVAAISAMIAYTVGFSSSHQQAIRIAGLVHDLGKQVIPNSILEKPGRLSTEEEDYIRQHTFHTYRVLKHVDGLGSIPAWAAFHHEKLDGSGYPFHLNSDQLSSGSRIMAVSDMFQALTEPRPYRNALPISRAIEILYEEAKMGTLDRRLVDALAETI